MGGFGEPTARERADAALELAKTALELAKAAARENIELRSLLEDSRKRDFARDEQIAILALEFRNIGNRRAARSDDPDSRGAGFSGPWVPRPLVARRTGVTDGNFRNWRLAYWRSRSDKKNLPPWERRGPTGRVYINVETMPARARTLWDGSAELAGLRVELQEESSEKTTRRKQARAIVGNKRAPVLR
jgi:hypothetical protein